jgi:ribonuclease R
LALKLKERLLALLGQPGYVPMNRGALAAKLGLNTNDARKLDFELRKLQAAGTIISIKGGCFCLPKDADLVTGTIQFRQSGSAFLRPDAGEKEIPGVQIAAEDTATAMHGDRVVVRLKDDAAPRRQTGPGAGEPAGSVIRILERGRSTLTGTLQSTRQFHFVAPDDPRFVKDIYVPDPSRSRLVPAPKIGDKVVVHVAEWLNRHVNPEGEITEVLGRTFEPRAELAAIYHKYRLETKFPEAVEREVAGLPDEVSAADTRNRLDLRKIPTITIDPDDAKDFDDALSLEELPSGEWRIGVHIADVGAYVRPGTALDTEAQNRGNSTYLVGTVIPMLPFKLSNGLCSLKEREDRLVKSVLFTFSRGGKIRRVEQANAVIHSMKRLTYKQAYGLLKLNDLNQVRRLPLPPAHQTGATGRSLRDLSQDELRQLQQMVRNFWTVASKLRADRMRNGSLDLDMAETKIFVDAEGYADRIETIENDESHQLIEEFMLLANEHVASLTRKSQMPSLYRVHDDPDEEKLAEFRQVAATHGIQAGDLTKRSEMSKLLTKVRTHPQGHILRVQLLRSLKRACYRASPDGHYGLNKRDYTHFTSPIRRYADLIVHRVFEYFLHKHEGAKSERGIPAMPRVDRMNSLAEHISITEANSTEAERESVKVKLLEFFERETKKRKRQEFNAVIVEIRNHGMFVELQPSQAFGLVHNSTLRDDMYYSTAGGTALVGRRTKRKFTLGQKIVVNVERVDRFKRQIDFRIAG